MTGQRLAGKVALVTGSTRGLGEEIAVGFAREGARVVVTGRQAADGAKVVDRITGSGGEAVFVSGDLTDEDSIAALVKSTLARFGALTVLVNNAAPTDHVTGATTGTDGKLIDKADAAIADLTTERWRKILTPGLDGLFWMLRHAIPAMRDSGGGSIVNISSVASVMGMGGSDAYTAIKGAMNALTRSIAVNYADVGIRCNTLVAGVFATAGAAPLLADPRLKSAFLDTILARDVAAPEGIVGPALFFASDESYYVTGQLLAVDGGLTVKVPVPKVEAVPEMEAAT